MSGTASCDADPFAAGEPLRMLNNSLRGLKSLPLRVTAA